MRLRVCLIAAATLLLLSPAMARPKNIVLDDFENLSGWTSNVSPGASLEIARDTGHTGMGMRLDFDFRGGGGYVIARKAFPVDLPPNYAFTFYLRGEALRNNFQFKLIGPDGQNVWWSVRPDYAFPSSWQQVVVRKRRIQYAWGPSQKRLRRIGSIEIALTASQGGKGSIWIDDLQLEPREPQGRALPPPKVTASTSVPGHDPALVLDKNGDTSWRSGTLAADQWLMLDFVKKREFGGLIIDWNALDYATDYSVQVSDDGEHWTTSYSTTTGNGQRDYVYMPDAESRYVRIELHRSSRGQGYDIRDVAVEPYEFSESPNQFFAAVAADAPPGRYPKYFYNKQSYWTVIGVNGDDKKALLNEEGMLEVDKSAFSIEPFVYLDGKLITWSAVHTDQELQEGYLPIPSVTWRYDDILLTVTAFAAGPPGSSVLYADYRLENVGAERKDADLFLAIRPFQVVPPWQSLNMVGGVSSIHDIRFDGRAVHVDSQKVVIPLTPADHFGAATFEEGLMRKFLERGKVPSQTQVSDSFGYASGALQYAFNLEPHAPRHVYLAVPFHQPGPVEASAKIDGAAAQVAAKRAETARYWRTVLHRVDFELPPSASRIADTLRTTLAYTLINRNGPAIQPGSRTYARAWIRDGSMMSDALLDMGFTEEPREFIRWFAGYQQADGRIPCCVDQRGADPVPENDSNGEFIYTVAEYYRYTHDVGFLNDMWPAVVKAVEYIDTLRHQSMTDEFKKPDMRVFYGILPASISHEGYSAHPEHSYWDDFFALRGLKDAAALATVVGDQKHAASFAALRDAFRGDLYASIARSMAEHKIDYIPASAELGDFDPTSTAIAVTPGGELPNLPEPALMRTFDKYYEHVQERMHSNAPDTAYTPYELRNVDALVRLGERDRAVDILDSIVADQRPPAWNEWAEVVWHDASLPRFIGDMPHTWVGSSFIRSIRSMFAYERESDDALVLASGLPGRWLEDAGGVAVTRLPTHYGVLSYRLRRDGPDALRLTMSGDLRLPPGQIVIRPPLPQPLREVTVNDKPIKTFTGDTATITEFPADVVMRWQLPTPSPTIAVTPSPTPSAPSATPSAVPAGTPSP